MKNVIEIDCKDIRFVKELYPRLKPIDDVVEQYRDVLADLPPIIVARESVLVDGYHRWQAHVREKAKTIRVEHLGNLTDAEIIRESIKRNATHGLQLSREDKQRMAVHLWKALSDLKQSERIEIMFWKYLLLKPPKYMSIIFLHRRFLFLMTGQFLPCEKRVFSYRARSASSRGQGA